MVRLNAAVRSTQVHHAAVRRTTSDRLDLRTKIDLDDFRGKTFYEFMKEVKPQLDRDSTTVFTIPTIDAVKKALDKKFDGDVKDKVNGALRRKRTTLDAVLGGLVGKTEAEVFKRNAQGEVIRGSDGRPLTKTVDITPMTIDDVIIRAGGPPMLAHVVALTAGAGVTVGLGTNVKYHEVGYAAGEDYDTLDTDVKSGRGYAETPKRKALDASHIHYLEGLKDVLKSNRPPKEYYTAIYKLLVKSDAANLRALGSSNGALETAMDFVTVYHAEGTRNLMDPDDRQHAWQKDLINATALGAYFVGAGGDPVKFWEESPRSNRSGIGITRTRRNALAEKVCQREKEINPELYEKLEALIGGPKPFYKGNLINQLTDYLNSPYHTEAVHENGDRIIEAAAEFMADLKKNARRINAGKVLPPA